MHWMHDDQEGLDLLRKVGFNGRTIARLYQLHKTYAQNALDQPSLDLRCLEFARWLVTTGGVSEQLSEYL